MCSNFEDILSDVVFLSFSFIIWSNRVCWKQSPLGEGVGLCAFRGTIRWQIGILVRCLKMSNIYLSLKLQHVQIQGVFRTVISIDTKSALLSSFRTRGAKSHYFSLRLPCTGVLQYVDPK